MADRPTKPQDPGLEILRYFTYEHLSPSLQKVSERFYRLAQDIRHLPAGPERSVALRKLLESKDAAVRAALDLVPDKEKK